MIELPRRHFIGGLIGLVAAPAIVTTSGVRPFLQRAYVNRIIFYTTRDPGEVIVERMRIGADWTISLPQHPTPGEIVSYVLRDDEHHTIEHGEYACFTPGKFTRL